jgi:hypothetical protein
VETLTLAAAEDTDRAAAGGRQTYLALRALRVVQQAGWADLVAADMLAGRYVLDVGTPTRPHYRTLHRGEPFWYCVGFGDACGGGDRVADLVDEDVPDLLDSAGAAAIIPRELFPFAPSMTVDGVRHLVDTGNLYVVYGLHRRRLLFRAEVDYVAAQRRARALAHHGELQAAARAADVAEEARAQWAAVRNWLPDVHERDGADLRPRMAPVVLPAVQQPRAPRLRRALFLADEAGWLSYLHPVDDGEAYVVEVRGVRRQVPADAVLPYVLGVGDGFGGAGRLVAYREGLG